MGRIYDALKKAERERQGDVAPQGRPEPAVLVDVAALNGPGSREPSFGAEEPSRPGATVDPAQTTVNPGVSGGPAPDPMLFAVAAPSSPAAENLRAIKTRVLRLYDDEGYRSLVVTSPGRGDGKTVTAANIALLLAAEIGRRVVLVDGDLRQPRLHTLFQVEQTPGVSDALLGRTRWSRAVVAPPWSALSLLPAGTPVTSPAELLNGPGAQTLFRELADAFQFVVIDTPPVLPVADSAVLAARADGVVLVARDGHTPRRAVGEATEALGKARLIGVVLNGLADPLPGWRGYRAY